MRPRVPIIGLAIVVSVAVGMAPRAVPSVAATDDYRPAPLLSAARAGAMVVRVDGRGGGSFEQGTGFALADGIVLTAAHLTDGQVLLVTRCNGTEAEPAEVLRSDRSDLAILVLPSTPMLSAPLAPTDPPIGAALLVPGFPMDGPLALARATVAGYYHDGGATVMELDPTPVDGQSGSPLLDADGRVVGLLVGFEEISGHGIAVPVSELRASIGRLAIGRIGGLADALVAPSSARPADRDLLPLLALDTGTERSRAAFAPRHPPCQ